VLQVSVLTLSAEVFVSKNFCYNISTLNYFLLLEKVKGLNAEGQRQVLYSCLSTK
jgi:hypothetical protein